VIILSSNKFLNNFNSTRQNIVIQNIVVTYVCLQTFDHRLIRLDCYYSRHVFKLSSEYAKLSRASPHINNPICCLRGLPNSSIGFVSPPHFPTLLRQWQKASAEMSTTVVRARVKVNGRTLAATDGILPPDIDRKHTP